MHRFITSTLLSAALVAAAALPASAAGSDLLTGPVPGAFGAGQGASQTADRDGGELGSLADAQERLDATATEQHPEVASATQDVRAGRSIDIVRPLLKDTAAEASVTVMGASWRTASAPDRVEYRTKAAEAEDWTAWEEWGPSDSGPDESSPEHRTDEVATDPIVVAQDETVQVRAVGPEAARATVRTVTTPTTREDEELAGGVVDENAAGGATASPAPSTGEPSQSSTGEPTEPSESGQPSQSSESAQPSAAAQPSGLDLATASTDDVEAARLRTAFGAQSAAVEQTGIGAGASDSNGTKKPAKQPAKRAAAQPRTASVSGGPTVGGLNYVSRSQWGAAKDSCGNDSGASLKAMAIHHTEGANGYSRAQVPGILRGIQAYHQQSRGWCDIGYNMLVDRFGTIYEGRAGGLDKGVVGAHTSGFNNAVYGVSVIGTYSKPAPAAVVSTLSNVASWLSARWGWDPNSTVKVKSQGGTTVKYARGTTATIPRIFGHRDTSDTDCPGNGLYGQLGKIRSSVKANRATMTGAIRSFYFHNSNTTSAPRAKAQCGLAGGGCYQAFGNGTVYWSKATGAQLVKSPSSVGRAYAAAKHEAGALGYPTGGEFRLAKARGATAQRFEHGAIVWSAQTHAQRVTGAVGAKWRAAGWERGELGLPTSNASCGLTGGGCFQSFQRGQIHYSKASGAHTTVRGSAITRAWQAAGAERGRLGYPTSDEKSRGASATQSFEHGTITWTKGKGARVSARGGSMTAGTH
ncbi:N-acetylmuramoyl-L-alanine amidase [Brevibacterium sp. BRM-1]|uniref:N-acetylmuramoyl-L-alanine amidase n=1 Tax=Brevibacterium sp. BRM-1 TaxID=2999062 RepID=UPI00227FE131|nr:N-acetylmuramoyl-L-alanine amidase [Brevibacterium sp. BRM-1]WAL40450.1 N-acetylmuramoyl-L-alanine amidase [Brevibacterium sp. BRM-1]